MQMQIGGTHIRGSNAENNQSCNLVLVLIIRQKPVDVTHDFSYYAKDRRLTGEPDGKRYQSRAMKERFKQLGRMPADEEAEEFRIK